MGKVEDYAGEGLGFEGEFGGVDVVEEFVVVWWGVWVGVWGG